MLAACTAAATADWSYKACSEQLDTFPHLLRTAKRVDVFTGEPHADFAKPVAVNRTASTSSGHRVRASPTAAAEVARLVLSESPLAAIHVIPHDVAFDARSGNGKGAHTDTLAEAGSLSPPPCTCCDGGEMSSSDESQATQVRVQGDGQFRTAAETVAGVDESDTRVSDDALLLVVALEFGDTITMPLGGGEDTESCSAMARAE